ncbi:rod shape-determining protein RodA [Lentisphaerota bacterium WC36G]|nr:rod shape-determining protein RodA [Lentisphaerae bacterium WC36]
MRINLHNSNHSLNSKNENSKLSAVIHFLSRFEWIQIFAIISLATIGLIFIYSTGLQRDSDAEFKKQIIWLSLGFITFISLSFFEVKLFKYGSLPFYLFVLSLLIIVLIPGIGLKIYGARRWLDLKIMRLQPSELAKISTLLMLSWVMSLEWFNINKFKCLMIAGAIVGLPFSLIVIEPDLGSSLVLIPVAIFVIFVAGYRWRNIIIISILGIILSLGGIINEVYQIKPLLKGYQRERVAVFLNPERDKLGRGWNQMQAKNAMGSGGLTGKGVGKGTINTLGYLPKTVSNNDFIFSVIGEELGFLGSAYLVFMYILLIISTIRIALCASEPFGVYFAIGVLGIILIHSFVNMGMSIGICPVTGLPLPLVSYGGSFMLSSMIMFGMLQSIYAHRKRD